MMTIRFDFKNQASDPLPHKYAPYYELYLWVIILSLIIKFTLSYFVLQISLEFLMMDDLQVKLID